MQIEFIDNASMSRKDRRLIRSHVMKGKNLGKTRAAAAEGKRKKRQLPTEAPTLDVSVSNQQAGCLRAAIHTAPCGMNQLGSRRLLWYDFSLASFPKALNDQSRLLVHRCGSKLGKKVDSLRSLTLDRVFISWRHNLSEGIMCDRELYGLCMGPVSTH